MKIDKRFRNVLILAVGIIIFFAWMDSLGMKMWQSVTPPVYAQAEPLYMKFFWNWAYAIIFLVAFVYYLVKKDLSETLAIASTSLILLFLGLEDIFYYIFTGHQFFGTTMPWLWENSPIMRGVAERLGYSTVVPQSLIIGVIGGFIVSYFLIMWFYKQKW